MHRLAIVISAPILVFSPSANAEVKTCGGCVCIDHSRVCPEKKPPENFEVDLVTKNAKDFETLKDILLQSKSQQDVK